MVTFWVRCGRAGLDRFPLRWQERPKVVLVGHRRQPVEHIPEVRQGIDAMTPAGDDDRVDDGRAFAGIGVTDEEPVLRAEFRRPDRIFDQAGIQLGLPMFQVRGQRRLLRQQVMTGRAQQRARAGAARQMLGQPVQHRQGPGKIALPQMRALDRIHPTGFVPGFLKVVELSDQLQDEARSLGRFTQRLVGAPPTVRPVTHQRDALMLSRIVGIGGIGIGVQHPAGASEQTRDLAMSAGQPPIEDGITPGATDHPQPALGRAPALFYRDHYSGWAFHRTGHSRRPAARCAFAGTAAGASRATRAIQSAIDWREIRAPQRSYICSCLKRG
jgi:hypothetical protein